MPPWLFYQEYAGTAIAKRTVPLKLINDEPLTLHDIYERLKDVDAKMHPLMMEQKRLLFLGEQGLSQLRDV